MSKFADFSQPQRQSLPGIVVMFANTLQKSVRAFWPILLIWIVKIETLNKFFVFGGITVAILIIALFNYYISVAKNESFKARFLEMA